MGATTPTQLNRTEVELVLQSGLFAKSQRLAKFFSYICERQLEGHGDEVKEYSIATEALGRSAEFDPKHDSIVRVEAHRLRKRLEEYYRGPGANHPIRIIVPSGQYRPQFVPQLSLEVPQEFASAISAAVFVSPVNSDPLLEMAVASVAGKYPARYRRLRKLEFGIVLLVIACCAIVVTIVSRKRTHPTPARVEAAPLEIWAPPSVPRLLNEVRMLAGYHGPSLVDQQGRTWFPDAYYKGGTSTRIAAHSDEVQPGSVLVGAQRSGSFRYDIPLRPYAYEVHLYLVETEYGPGTPDGGGESTRLFRVSINDKVALQNFDPLAEAGAPNRLYERVFKDVHPAPDGKLHILFEPVTAPAILNAIEIVPSAPGRIHPVRIVAQQTPVTDSDGHLWSADRYFSGGRSVVRTSVVANCQEPLYDGERYGNFRYRIPLAPGRYRVTLHFAETWFGQPTSGPANSRIFHVFANGVALLRNFQVAKEAGGANRSLRKVFNNLEPNAQGLLLLDFVPVKNYAEVNAIEVVETS